MAVITIGKARRKSPISRTQPHPPVTEARQLPDALAAAAAAPPPVQLDLAGARVFAHDPDNPQWRFPMVWEGESERQVRELAAHFGFERIPYSFEEFMAFMPYVCWMRREKESLNCYSAQFRDAVAQASVEVTAMYYPAWFAGTHAYMAGDMAELESLHRGDDIYRQLLTVFGDELEKELATQLVDYGFVSPTTPRDIP